MSKDNSVVKTSWAFTLNNYTEKEEQQLKDLECSYIVFGHEIGEEKGTPHLQGSVTFTKAYRLSGLKKLNPRISWLPVIGEEFSANYCMKDRDYFLKDRRKQGERTDLQKACKIVQENNNCTELKKSFPELYIKYHHGFEKLIEYPKREKKPRVVWYWGKTGSGKTRTVIEKHKNDKIWISGKNLKWWQGYEQQRVVLIDDFRGDFCTFHELLRILDRYPYTVEVKNSSRELNSEYIYITSCYPPTEVYETREDIGQLLRRIDEIIEL